MTLKRRITDSKALPRTLATLSRAAGESKARLTFPPLAPAGEGWRAGSIVSVLVAVALFLVACSPKGEALYTRAEQALDKGDVQAAIIDLKNLVKDEPGNARARALLAAALVEDGEISAAAIEIQKAKDLGVPGEALLVPECRIMVARGEFDEAVEKCLPDAVPAASQPEMHVVQGRALLGLERPADAEPHFEAALAARPDSLDALLGLASANYALEGLPAAKTVMDGASPDMMQQPRYWMTMGSIEGQGGDWAAAEAAYQKALDSSGTRGGSSTRLMALGAIAEAQMRQGDVDAAKSSTDQLIKAAPDNPLVKQLRGQVEAAGGNLEEARTLLEEAVAAMPENYDARLLLGLVNLQQGNVGQAEMHFQTVVANQPSNARALRLLAEVRARQQTPDETLESLQSALTAGNVDPTMLAMAGRISLAAGRREQALAYFSQAAAESSEDQPTDVQLEVAAGYLAAGDFDRAIELLGKIPEGGTAGLQREYLLLTALLKKGDTAQAIAEARQLAARKGSDPKVRNLVAGVYVAAGQRGEARRELGEALKIKADDVATLINLARLDLIDGKTAEAENGFRGVLVKEPKNLVATIGLGAAAALSGKNGEAEKWLTKAHDDHPQSIEAQLVLTQFYLSMRDFAKAERVIDDAAKNAPNNAALSNARGLVKMALGDTAGAITSFDQAVAQAPSSDDYALNLARAHIANRDVDGALGVLDGMLKSDPKYAPVLTLAAMVSLQFARIEKAAGYIERLRTAAPNSSSTMILEGDLAMAQKRYSAALVSYRAASAKSPSAKLVLAEYRAALLSRDSHPEKVLEDWVAKNPGDVGVVPALAEFRSARGDISGAIALYEAALLERPEDPVLLNNAAILYAAQENAKAVEYAARAYKVAANAPAIADTYGWILLKQGETEKSVKLLREAAKGLPNNGEVQFHLAAALAKSGDTAEAADLVQKALKGGLPAEQKAEAQKLLEQLTK